MTERPDHLPAADDPVGLRLFADSEGEAASAENIELLALEGQGAEADVDFDELPDDLLVLAERLTSESQELSRTYPARTPARLPIGEATVIASGESQEPIAAVIDRREERASTQSPPRRRLGLGVAAAAGFVAIVGSALYLASTEAARRATGQADGGAAFAVPSETDTPHGSVPAIPVRTVSLSLADEGDYRRLEGLLRDRSEPEREALFDLLEERSGEGSDEATAVRISF